MGSKTFVKSWGSEFVTDSAVRFRLWAPGQDSITLRLNGQDQPMKADDDGWFELEATGVSPGAEYQFVLADGMAVPDPASRAQKADVNGPSLVINPDQYAWQNTGWQGRPWEETVVYEMHFGTFTPEGTYRSAIEKLPYLAELGITMIEVLPVSQFGGNRGWGYDGVLLYAPHSAYGTPDDFKAFVDAAHGYGLSVVLDIVLNHFGPEGNYLPLLAPDFFHKERMTPWGPGIAYDVDAVRRYIVEAPLYWLKEYHLDGLRFDAIDNIDDNAQKHVLKEIAERIRAINRATRRCLPPSGMTISTMPFTPSPPAKPTPITRISPTGQSNMWPAPSRKGLLTRVNTPATRVKRAAWTARVSRPSPLSILFKTTIRPVTAPRAIA